MIFEYDCLFACLLACLLARLIVRLLACSFVCLLACWFVCGFLYCLVLFAGQSTSKVNRNGFNLEKQPPPNADKMEKSNGHNWRSGAAFQHFLQRSARFGLPLWGPVHVSSNHENGSISALKSLRVRLGNISMHRFLSEMLLHPCLPKH